MVAIILNVSSFVVVFFLGTLVGAKSPVSVQAAIAKLKAAQLRAEAVIDQITAHKAS
jgi:hypothetical protein